MSFLWVAVAVGAAGCSNKASEESAAQYSEVAAPLAAVGPMGGEVDAPAAPPEANRAVDRLSDADQGKRPRKIVRTGMLTIEVDDQEAVRESIARVVREAGGFVAAVDVGRLQGAVGSASLVLRIPEERLDAAVAALAQLGTVRRESLRAEDVSETYYDLAARLRNGKRLEERLVELASKAAGVKDLLEVEREIGRVREQVEVMEGQLRGLDDRTSLATLTVEVMTRTVYVPYEEPGLGAKIENAFEESLEALAESGEALLLFLVSAVPWLIPIGAGAWLLRRRLRRRAE